MLAPPAPCPYGQNAPGLLGEAARCQEGQYRSIGSNRRDDRGDPDALGLDRFYVMSDAGSFYLDEEHPDGFGTAVAAAEWAQTQTLWTYGSELDFSDGVTSTIVLGSEVNAANAAWQMWADSGGDGLYPEVTVRNYAIGLGLVTNGCENAS